jgi:inosose dehydratase
MVSSIEVGTASVNWGFDPLYTWAKTPTFKKMLDEMAASGYSGTEIGYNFPSDVADLRSQLERRKLRAAGTFHPLDLRESSKYDAALHNVIPVAERLQALGADVLILSDAPTTQRLAVAGSVASDGSDGLHERGWQALTEGLNRIGEFLAARGMRAVFHPHVGTYVETRAEIDRLCDLTDPALIGLCPDTGHLAYAGADPAQVFHDYADRIGHVHLKDVDPDKLSRVRKDRIDFAGAVALGLFVPLGTGMVEISRIVDALRHAAYRGWIVVEQDAPADPLRAALENRRYLRREFEL